MQVTFLITSSLMLSEPRCSTGWPLPRYRSMSMPGPKTAAPVTGLRLSLMRLRTPGSIGVRPPLRTGSRIAFTAHFLGRHLAYTYEVTDYTPTERLVMQTAQGPFPMETTYTWQAIAGHSTRMSLRNRGEPAGFSRLAAPFMAIAIRRANRKDLGSLRAILETA